MSTSHAQLDKHTLSRRLQGMHLKDTSSLPACCHLDLDHTKCLHNVENTAPHSNNWVVACRCLTLNSTNRPYASCRNQILQRLHINDTSCHISMIPRASTITTNAWMPYHLTICSPYHLLTLPRRVRAPSLFTSSPSHLVSNIKSTLKGRTNGSPRRKV